MMKRYLILFLAIALLNGFAQAKEPENLHTAKERTVFYHDSREYNYDQEVVVL